MIRSRAGRFLGVDKPSFQSYVCPVGAPHIYRVKVSPLGQVALRVLGSRTLLTSAQIVDGSSGEIPQGSIWRVLNSLIRKGLISWEWAPKAGRYSGKPRKRFRITREGAVASGHATGSEFALAMVGGLADEKRRHKKSIKESVGDG